MNRRLELHQPLLSAENALKGSYEAPAVPVAVRLDDRAVALEGIMAYLNKANRVHGSATLLASGGGKFGERYGQRAIEVQQGAAKGRDELLVAFNEGIKTLVAEEALKANGMDEADVEVERISLQAKINRELGVGRGTAGQRAKVIRKAKNAARHIIK